MGYEVARLERRRVIGLARGMSRFASDFMEVKLSETLFIHCGWNWW